MRLNFLVRYYADTEVGAKLTLDGEQAKKTMKDFKQEIRQAKEDLLNMSATFGETSKEALAAAQKVAKLQDAIKDANETAQLFDPGNKFQVVGNAVRGLVGGFTALQGALALVGAEGEEVQKTLLKVQGALALSEGLNTVADMGKDFQRLGSVLVQTLGRNGLIGVAIAGVTALGVAIYAAFKNTEKLTDEQKRYNEATEIAFNKEGDRIASLTMLIDKIKQGGLTQDEKTQTLEKYNSELGDTLGKYQTYQQLEDNLIKNGPKYVQYLMTKAKAEAAYGMLLEEYKKRFELERKKASEFTGFSILGIFFDDEETHEKNKKDALDRQEKDINDISSLYANLNKEANKLSDELKLPSLGGAVNKSGNGKNADEPAEIQDKKWLDQWMLDLEIERHKKLMEVKEIQNTEISTLDNDRFMKSSALQEAQTQLERNQAEERVKISQWEAQSRIYAAQSVAGALGALSDLVGKQTSAGKALAIAQATINTWLGVTEVLRTKSVLPEPLATISRIANIAAVVASGIGAVKNIVKTNIPGGYGGASSGGSSTAVTAPLTPQATVTNTMLNQGQLNQIGNAAARAFVLESDVTNNQERIRRLNRAARLG